MSEVSVGVSWVVAVVEVNEKEVEDTDEERDEWKHRQYREEDQPPSFTAAAPPTDHPLTSHPHRDK